MSICLAELNNKNLFLSFNVVDLPVLQGYQGTGTSPVGLHPSPETHQLITVKTFHST